MGDEQNTMPGNRAEPQPAPASQRPNVFRQASVRGRSFYKSLDRKGRILLGYGAAMTALLGADLAFRHGHPAPGGSPATLTTGYSGMPRYELVSLMDSRIRPVMSDTQKPLWQGVQEQMAIGRDDVARQMFITLAGLRWANEPTGADDVELIKAFYRSIGGQPK